MAFFCVCVFTRIHHKETFGFHQVHVSAREYNKAVCHFVTRLSYGCKPPYGGVFLAHTLFTDVWRVAGLGIVHYLMPVLPVMRGFTFHKYESFFNPLFALYLGQWFGGLLLIITGLGCGKVSVSGWSTSDRL
jgi:hypothetical protein